MPKEDVPLTGAKEATLFRRAAAKANYIAPDRLDIAFASKDLSRSMANPSRGEEIKAKRLARYLKLYPRCILRFRWQGRTSEVSAFTD